MKKFKYYQSISWKENDLEMSILTQLYKIGIYLIMYQDGNHILQTGITPQALVRKQKEQIAEMEKDSIEFELGREMCVAEVDGFWKEIS